MPTCRRGSGGGPEGVRRGSEKIDNASTCGFKDHGGGGGGGGGIFSLRGMVFWFSSPTGGERRIKTSLCSLRSDPLHPLRTFRETARFPRSSREFSPEGVEGVRMGSEGSRSPAPLPFGSPSGRGQHPTGRGLGVSTDGAPHDHSHAWTVTLAG